MKKVLLSLAACVIAVTTFAQVDEVTLTVIGTGVDEEKATLQALRSAIEQSFGTFVSANTTILNDKLVQDEIVSVSNGNVKEYKKLAVAALPNGQISVSVQATVSINKLISYAKSKGSQAEFAGQTFAANVKLMKLRSESATKTYELMVQQLERLAKDMFDFELVLTSSPVLQKDNAYQFDAGVVVYSNNISSNFSKLFTSTRDALKISDSEAQAFKNAGVPYSSASRLGVGTRCRGSIYLPIEYEKLCQFNGRIRKAYVNALQRFKIQEISNHSNYYYVNSNHYLISSLFGEICHTEITSHPDEVDADIARSSSDFYSKDYIILSNLIIEEIRTPVTLSNKDKKAQERGQYQGSTYTVSYGSQKIIYRIPVKVKVNASMIDKCQGFELIGVSAPTNKATGSSRSSSSSQSTGGYNPSSVNYNGILGY